MAKIIASSKVITEEKAEQYKYVNESGDSKQYMPKMVKEETPVLLTNDKYKVAFSPISDDEIQEDTMFENKTGKVEVESDNVTDTERKKEMFKYDTLNDYILNERRKKTLLFI